jgi:serine/threonine-protein kinase
MPATVFPDLPGVGERVAGKYEIEGVLGAGGMGVVVAARHVQLGQRVAIKFLRREAALEQSAVERFLREARAAVTLASEHATKVFDIGTLESGEPYMVMEHLTGTDLSELLNQRGPLGIQEAVDVVLQASEAIAEAHAHGIVHRDLKPSNLFVTKGMDGRSFVKVLDFGISKVTKGTEGSSTLTASGSVMGSPVYMSPEQVRNSKGVDPRSDIWGLGVILYELFTGTQPFPGETFGEIFAKILSESPRPIRALRPEIPAALSEVVSRCLERDLGQRVQNVAQLASMLLPFAQSASALSVERIRHVSRAEPGTSIPREETAAHTATLTLDADRASPPSETNGSWQRSGSSKGPPGRSMAGLWALFGAGLVVAAVIGAVAWGRFHQAIVAAPAVAIAPAATPPPVQATSAPDIQRPPSDESPTTAADQQILKPVHETDSVASSSRKTPTPLRPTAPVARPPHPAPPTSSMPPSPKPHYDQY